MPPSHQDPPVRGADPFTHSAEDATGPDDRKRADDSDGHIEAERQAEIAGSGTTGREVVPIANSDESLYGFDETRKRDTTP